MNKKAQKPSNNRAASPEDVELGKKIRLRRIEQRMSQAELGQTLGVSFQQVQKYEKGVNRVSTTRIQQIAKALDIGTDYFMKVSSKSESGLMTLITDGPSQRLLLAFHKIDDPVTRHRVVGLLEAITAEAA